jgi:hypothetical protein
MTYVAAVVGASVTLFSVAMAALFAVIALGIEPQREWGWWALMVAAGLAGISTCASMYHLHRLSIRPEPAVTMSATIERLSSQAEIPTSQEVGAASPTWIPPTFRPVAMAASAASGVVLIGLTVWAILTRHDRR